jgi:hypothetical protein
VLIIFLLYDIDDIDDDLFALCSMPMRDSWLGQNLADAADESTFLRCPRMGLLDMKGSLERFGSCSFSNVQACIPVFFRSSVLAECTSKMV